MKEIVNEGILEKLSYYALLVEFQVCGSLHIHSLLKIQNVPVFWDKSIPEDIDFINNVIRCDVPETNLETSLFELVTIYQLYRQSKSCKKRNENKCRYAFGNLFTEKNL